MFDRNLGWGLVCIVCALIACKKSKPELDENHLKPEEAKAHAAKVRPKLDALAKLKPASISPTQTNALQLTPQQMGSRKLDDGLLELDSADTFWVYDTDLAKPLTQYDGFSHRLKGTGRVAACALKVQAADTGEGVLKKPGFAGCENIKYVAIVRMTTNTDPKLAGTEDNAAEKTRTHRFEPGNVAGDVLIFELESGKHLGGFRYSATSSETPSWDRGLMDSLHDDLEKNTREAIEAAFEKTLYPASPSSSAKGSVKKPHK